MEEDTKFMEWLAVVERDALYSERPSPVKPKTSRAKPNPRAKPITDYKLTIERLLTQGKQYARKRDKAKLMEVKSTPQLSTGRNHAKLSPSSMAQTQQADRLMKVKNHLLLKLERLKIEQAKSFRGNQGTPTLCKRSLSIARSQARPKAVEDRLILEGHKQQARLSEDRPEPDYCPLISAKAAKLMRSGSVTTRLYNYCGIYTRHLEKLQRERSRPSFTPTIITCSRKSSPILKSCTPTEPPTSFKATPTLKSPTPKPPTFLKSPTGLKSPIVIKRPPFLKSPPSHKTSHASLEEFPFTPLICNHSLKLVEGMAKRQQQNPKVTSRTPLKLHPFL